MNTKHLLTTTALGALLASGAAMATSYQLNAPFTCSASNVCVLDIVPTPPASDYQLNLPFTCTSGVCTGGTWGVTPPPIVPTIASGTPADQSVATGTTATFSATVSGTPTPTCQWTENGVAISGATTCASYAKTSPTTADNGELYAVVATNVGGSATSRSAKLTVTNSAITYVGTTFTNPDGSGNLNMSPPGSLTSGSTLLLAYVATENGTSDPPTPTGWTKVVDGPAVGTPGEHSVLYSHTYNSSDTVPYPFGTSSNVYYPEGIMRAYNGATVRNNTTCGSTTTSCVLPLISETPNSNEIYVGFTTSDNNDGFTLPTGNTNVATASGSPQRPAKAFDLPLTTSVPAQTISVGTADYWEAIAVTLTPSGGSSSSAPVIAVNPANVKTTAGLTATFTAVETGSPTPTCQWSKAPSGGGFSTISGATSCSSYTTPTLTTGDNGNTYEVVATNSVGSATSSVATLTVGAQVSTTTFDQWGLPLPPIGGANNTTAVPAIAWLHSLAADTCGTNNCGGPSQSGTVAGDAAQLEYTGIYTSRPDGNFNNFAWLIAVAQASGTKVGYQLGNPPGIPNITTSQITSILLANAKQLANAGVLGWLEGQDEPDNFGLGYNGAECGAGNGWLPCAQFMSDTYAIFKADPVVKNYFIGSVSNNGSEYPDYGLEYALPTGIPVSAGTLNGFAPGTVFEDGGNYHPYQNGANAGHPNIAWYMGKADEAVPSIPYAYFNYYTDFVNTWLKGYSGVTNTQAADVRNTARITTEWDVPETGTGGVGQTANNDTIGIHILESFLGYYAQGSRVNAVFSMCADPNVQGMGLYPYNCAAGVGALPAGDMMHSATSFLKDIGDVPSPATISGLSLSGSTCPSDTYTGGGDSECHWLLMQKSATAAYNPGSMDWVIWDENGGASAPSMTATIGATYNHVNVYDLTNVVSPSQTVPSSPTPIASCTSCSSVSWTWGLLSHPGVANPPVVVEFYN